VSNVDDDENNVAAGCRAALLHWFNVRNFWPPQSTHDTRGIAIACRLSVRPSVRSSSGGQNRSPPVQE